MHFALETGRLVERSGHHRDVVEIMVFPEHHRSAIAAETARRIFAGGIPFDVFLTGDGDGILLDIRCRIEMAGLLAALRAMAINDPAQLAMRLEADASAQTRSTMQFRHQDSLRSTQKKIRVRTLGPAPGGALRNHAFGARTSDTRRSAAPITADRSDPSSTPSFVSSCSRGEFA